MFAVFTFSVVVAAIAGVVYEVTRNQLAKGIFETALYFAAGIALGSLI